MVSTLPRVTRQVEIGRVLRSIQVTQHVKQYVAPDRPGLCQLPSHLRFDNARSSATRRSRADEDVRPTDTRIALLILEAF
jgi:hypothetical protein